MCKVLRDVPVSSSWRKTKAYRGPFLVRDTISSDPYIVLFSPATSPISVCSFLLVTVDIVHASSVSESVSVIG